MEKKGECSNVAFSERILMLVLIIDMTAKTISVSRTLVPSPPTPTSPAPSYAHLRIQTNPSSPTRDLPAVHAIETSDKLQTVTPFPPPSQILPLVRAPLPTQWNPSSASKAKNHLSLGLTHPVSLHSLSLRRLAAITPSSYALGRGSISNTASILTTFPQRSSSTCFPPYVLLGLTPAALTLVLELRNDSPAAKALIAFLAAFCRELLLIECSSNERPVPSGGSRLIR